MTAIRCARCGQYGAVTSKDSGNWDHYCIRCVRVLDFGADECYEAVTDRDGNEEPCERPAYDLRVDAMFGGRYPVCRKHYRPPFEECRWDDDFTRCEVHGGVQDYESQVCSKAFEA